MITDLLKAQFAKLSAEEIVDLLNIVSPATRAAVVHSVMATYCRVALVDKNLARLLGETLNALAIGVFVVESGGPSWQSSYATDPRVADQMPRSLKVIEAVSVAVKRTVNDLAGEFELTTVQA